MPRPTNPKLHSPGLTGAGLALLTSYTFCQFRVSPKDETSVSASLQPKLETIPTFFTLFIFGFLCHIILTWDALRLRNIIQITGICITNGALLVYAVIQIGQINDAVNDLVASDIIQKQDIWDELRPVLIAIPCVMAILSLCMSANAWKLLQEFAWDIMKHMGADYRMKKRFLHYQASRQSSCTCVGKTNRKPGLHHISEV